MFQMMYPVGSIYISVTNTNPSDLFGGTWEQIKDLFLLSAGDTYSVGETGGSATHTLTVNEMPNHNHTLKGSAVGSSDKGETVAYGGATSGIDMRSLSSTGGGQSFSIMPPYLAVYMWKRIG